MGIVDATILTLGCAVLLVLLTRRLAIPYPSILVLGGLAVALVPGAPLLAIQPSAALSIFLPAVLFQEASRISWREARRNALSIGLVAPILIVGTCAAVAGVAIWLFPGIPIAVAIVIGAVVAPADSMASKAVLARLKVPRRTVATLIGEGLVNDAIAVVIYKMGVAAVLGSFVSVGAALSDFTLLTLGGICFGIAVGWAGAWLLRTSGEPMIYSLTSLSLAFLTYVAADTLGMSGALATVATGVMCSVRAERISAELRFNAAIVWQIVTFALNAAGFLLIGVQLPSVLADLGFYTTRELAGYAATVCATILMVRLLIVVAVAGAGRMVQSGHADRRHSWREDIVIGWSGMRGLVTLAAALGLPSTMEGSVFPYRDLTLFLAFATILFTLVGQGMTLAPIVRAFGVGDDRTGQNKRSARIKTAEAVLLMLDEWATSEDAPVAELEPIRAEYLSRIAHHREPDAKSHPARQNGDVTEIRLKVIDIERQKLLSLAFNHDIDENLLHELLAELDVSEVAAGRRDTV